MGTGSIQRDATTSGIEIVPDASPSVRAALEQTKGCEDVRFSPSNRRMALAKWDRNAIAVVDVDIAADDHRPHVTVTDVAEFSSPYLKYPHGVDFLDDETIIVANRDRDVTVFRLPSDGGQPAELTPIDPPPGRRFELLNAPGSLAIATGADGGTEVLVCNNHGNTITRHSLDDVSLAVTSSNVLLRRWLSFPDGIALAADGAWIAVSNHHAHIVTLYEPWESLHEDADPDCILRGVSYPHGVRFSADARHIFVADCGGPYVHVFGRDGQTWRGVQYPNLSVRVMDDDVFQQHPRCNLGDGGPKGIDIDRRGHVLAVTSEYQRLAFFDLSAILERSTGRCPDSARQLSYELEVLERTRVLEAHIAALKRSMSFRLTTPLRALKATWLKTRR